jgi:hypothetical protein
MKELFNLISELLCMSAEDTAYEKLKQHPIYTIMVVLFGLFILALIFMYLFW